MATCSFCQYDLKPGTGTMFVYATGKVVYFCSSKCEKNVLKFHRKPAFFKWTKAYQKGVKVKEKEVPEKKATPEDQEE